MQLFEEESAEKIQWKSQCVPFTYSGVHKVKNGRYAIPTEKVSLKMTELYLTPPAFRRRSNQEPTPPDLANENEADNQSTASDRTT